MKILDNIYHLQLNGMSKLVENIDFYFENINGTKFKVFTEHYHKERGFCCKSICRHCPYRFNENAVLKKTSLEEFNELVDKYYISLKKYIISSNNKKVILEDFENYAWGKNPDLSSLLENPCPLPIKNMEVSYIEKSCSFIITLTLK